MKVLVACEESQAVTKAFRQLGHEAYSCDIVDQSGGHPEWHIMQDVREILNPKPVSLFSNSICGDPVRWGIEFFTTDHSHHFVEGNWDMIIAHPPCTYFSTAGANWLFRGGKLDEERYKKGLEMKALFMEIYNAECPKIAIENVRAIKIWELPPHTQEIQPWQFGHNVSKITRLWLKNLPPLTPTEIVSPDKKWISCGYKNRDLQNNAVCKAYNKRRSETFPGIAKAMAEQWGQE